MKSKSFNQIELLNEKTIKTGNILFDEWFSKDGGIVPGSIIFVTGTSGAGKTTLMVNLMNWLKGYKLSLYSREMSIGSIKDQMSGYKFNNPTAYFVDETDCSNLDEYFKELEAVKPEFVIVDSLQAIAIADFPEMGEEKASIIVRQKLEQWCRLNGATLFLIGHNTKDNEFAGKNTNMQMVDAHMVLEYDQKTETRKIFWGKKNRKGPMGKLYYTINNGEISFSESSPNDSIGGNVSFYSDFEKFVKGYISKINKNDENLKIFKKELNTLSNKIYSECHGSERQYLINFMPSFYILVEKYNLD
jgi:predicted ATP-dependent serine protease